MDKIINGSFEEKSKVALIGKALSSEDRIKILEFLDDGHLTVNEIAEKLSIPVSTSAVHVKVLEEANFITTRLEPGVRGSKKVCYKSVDGIELDLVKKNKNKVDQSYYINMPIGNYTDCSIKGVCGIVSELSNIGVMDNPSVFYYPNRNEAQLIWFEQGYLEYKFPSLVVGEITSLNISFECCSEAPSYNTKWPSDITLWVNDKEVHTWTCPGDFGGRRGKLNPLWWPEWSTQYGILKNYRISDLGTYCDEEYVGSSTLRDLELGEKHYISVRIGIKEGAKNVRGLNLFGEKFGDHNQSIVMRIDYKQKI